MIKKPVYDPVRDGNVFVWLLKASEMHRVRRREEDRVIKEASAESKRLDRPEMAYQKW